MGATWKKRLVTDEVYERQTKTERNNKYHNEIDAKRKKEDVDKERAKQSHEIERKGKTNGEKSMKQGVEMDANERLAKARRELESKNHLLQVQRWNKKVREVDEKHVTRE